jgi:hypothetical protein
MPPELIWPPDSENIPSFPQASLQEIEDEGVTLVIQPLGINAGRIVQIRSTDPNVFLRREYQPGRLVSFKAQLGKEAAAESGAT